MQSVPTPTETAVRISASFPIVVALIPLTALTSERARGQDIYRIRVEKNHSGKRIGDSGGSKNEQSERDETDI